MTDAPEPRLVETRAAGAAAVRGSVLQSGAYVATFLLSLVSAPLLFRHLGPAGFGRYTTVVSLVTVIAGLTDAGMVNIALREWTTRAGEDRRATMRLLLGIRLELGVAGVALGTGYALVAGFGDALVIGTILAGAGMLLQILADVLAVAMQGELRFGWPAVITVTRQAVAVALIVMLVLAGAGLLPFLAVTIPAGVATLALTAWVVRGRMPLRPALYGPEGWALVRGTLPYAAAIAVNTVYFQVTILVMHQLASPTQTGYFALSFRVVQVLIGVPSLAIGAAFPILAHSARADSERFAAASARILELAAIAGVPVVLAVVLGAPFIVLVLGGHAGAPATPVLQIQAFALLATFTATASGFPLLSLRRNTALLLGNGAALTANVALSLALVPLDHAQGAAISAVAAESCLAVGQLAFLLRAAPVRPSWSTVGVALGAGLIGGAAQFVSVGSPLRALIGLAAYMAVLAVCRRLPPELAHLRRAGTAR
ncbi:MAG TPA: oligosaccharide flippase family protein [Solirubrobacteraceae bacterium]|nr:oligosaccharide flippase family protein [Solirubrobacteraceae bacterium]